MRWKNLVCGALYNEIFFSGGVLPGAFFEKLIFIIMNKNNFARPF
jgi:hypothetical protein